MFEKAARSHLPVARQDIRGTREVVMPFTRGLAGHTSHHEIATRAEVARRIAHMKGCGVSDELPQALWPARTYLIPSETVVGLELAKSIGLHGEDDLFGGVVPHAFIASKAITHPLVSPNSKRPEGWNPQFHELVFVNALKTPQLLSQHAQSLSMYLYRAQTLCLSSLLSQLNTRQCCSHHGFGVEQRFSL
jgi:hypothetical protein